MAVQQVRSAPVATKPTTTPSAADLKAASHFKADVNEVLKRVRFGAPLAATAAPKVDAKGQWRAPNGDKLISVTLSKPPAGMADGMTTLAFVNPKTNEFFHGTFGGIAGLRQFHGPMQLPASSKLKDTNLSAKELEALTAAANRTSTAGGATVPTKTSILNALGTYEFHKLVKWSAKGPKDAEVLKKVPLKKDGHPDGFSYTGLVLKSNPNKVVVVRTGGIAGLTQYTQPMDVTRLPK